MLTAICDAVEYETRKGRPCVAIRAYREDRANTVHHPDKSRFPLESNLPWHTESHRNINAVRSHQKLGAKRLIPKYPEAPVRIQVKNDPRQIIANDIEIYELSVGITSFSLYIDNPAVDLEWLIGKTLHLETFHGS
jgi:hypothetical protein